MTKVPRSDKKKLAEQERMIDTLIQDVREHQRNAELYMELFFYMCDGYQELKEKYELHVGKKYDTVEEEHRHG